MTNEKQSPWARDPKAFTMQDVKTVQFTTDLTKAMLAVGLKHDVTKGALFKALPLACLTIVAVGAKDRDLPPEQFEEIVALIGDIFGLQMKLFAKGIRDGSLTPEGLTKAPDSVEAQTLLDLCQPNGAAP